MMRTTRTTRPLVRAVVLISLAVWVAGCGGSQDECPESRVAECDGNTAKICVTQEDGGSFGDDILVWFEEECGGPTPHCRSFGVPDSPDEHALCSATEEKVCDPDDEEICLDGDVFGCDWGYPDRRKEKCDGQSEECVRVDGVRAECRSTN